MAGGNLTPRQKMINMMYLVLLALLALNVSKQVLNAFALLYNSLDVTNLSLLARNEKLYSDFEKELANDPVKVTPIYEKASRIRKLVKDLKDYIDTMIINIIVQTERGISKDSAAKIAKNLMNLQGKDNTDAPTIALGMQEPKKPSDAPYTALALKKKLIEFKEEIVNIAPETDKAYVKELIDKSINLDSMEEADKKKVPWEIGLFFHVPAAGVLTTLNKIKSDIASIEGDIVSRLLSTLTADIFRFDRVGVKSFQSAPFVFIGDSFKAEVMMAAWSSTIAPIVKLGRSIKRTEDGSYDVLDTNVGGIKRIENGVFTFVVVPSSEGEQKYAGTIAVKKPDGSLLTDTFSFGFKAFKPIAVVSAPATAVFYRGLDNPLEVSVPGVPPEKISVSIVNGTITGSKGKYIVRPGEGKESIITVSIGGDKGSKRVGEFKYRVKDVPAPTPFFGMPELTGSCKAPSQKLLAAKGVGVELKDFVFEGVKFDVVSWKLSTVYKGNVIDQEVTGPYKTSKIDEIIKNLPKKSKISIIDIKVKGPDGKVKQVSPIVIEII